MKYDFIEIGTSNFNTLIQTCSEESHGISIEPLLEYLNELPNKKNVVKINCAVSPNGKEGLVNIFYVPLSVVKEKKVKNWIGGCASINRVSKLQRTRHNRRYVKSKKVACLSLSTIFKENEVSSVDLIKIDTEGCDCGIMESLYKCIINNEIPKPPKIVFEIKWCDPTKVYELFKELGYGIEFTKQDAILTLSI